MATCEARHPETGRQCESEEHDGRTLCIASFPVLMWRGLPVPPLCGEAHSSGVTCGLYAHGPDEWHSTRVGGGWLKWSAGRDDKWSWPRTREENNRLSEAADKAAYESGRGMDTERASERVWRWW
jgi:hypothetical protein